MYNQTEQQSASRGYVQQQYQTPYQQEVYQKHSPDQKANSNPLQQSIENDTMQIKVSPPKFDTQQSTFKFLILEIDSGHSAGLQYWISRHLEFPIKVGRGQQNQVILQEDDISTLHCYMWYDSSKHQFYIQDRGSLHGTFIKRNEETTNVTGLKRTPGQKVELQLGDLLKLGQSNAFKVTASSQEPPSSAILVSSHNTFNESFNMKPVASIDLDRGIGLQASQSESISTYLNGSKPFQTPKVLKPQNKLQVEVPRNKEWLQEISDQINDFKIQTSPIKQTSTYSDFRLLISSVSIQGRDHSRQNTANQDYFFWDVPIDENKENLDNEHFKFHEGLRQSISEGSKSPSTLQETSYSQVVNKPSMYRPSGLKLPFNVESQIMQNYSMVTLLDGHGGTECTHQVRQNLPQNIQQSIQFRCDLQQQTPSKRNFHFYDIHNESKKSLCLGNNSPTITNNTTNTNCNKSNSKEDFHGSISPGNSTDSINQALSKQFYKELFKEAFQATDSRISTDDGCTCTTLLFQKEQTNDTPRCSSSGNAQSHTIKLTCANVGDSHALVWKGTFPNQTNKPTSLNQEDQIYQQNSNQEQKNNINNFQQYILTEDHRVASDNESKRLNSIQAPIHNGRLFGLNISRCLGDTQLKNQDVGFTNEPYVSQTIEIQNNETALVIVASDGLWDFVSFEEINQLVQDDILEQLYQVQLYYQQQQQQKEQQNYYQQQQQSSSKQQDWNSNGLEKRISIEQQLSQNGQQKFDLKDIQQQICMDSIRTLLQKALHDSKDDITIGLCMVYNDYFQ